MDNELRNVAPAGFDADRLDCPECGSDWRGPKIPEAQQKFFATNSGYFSRLIGVELPYGHPKRHDGVSYWECPDCAAAWSRFPWDSINDLIA